MVVSRKEKVRERERARARVCQGEIEKAPTFVSR